MTAKHPKPASRRVGTVFRLVFAVEAGEVTYRASESELPQGFEMPGHACVEAVENGLARGARVADGIIRCTVDWPLARKTGLPYELRAQINRRLAELTTAAVRRNDGAPQSAELNIASPGSPRLQGNRQRRIVFRVDFQSRPTSPSELPDETAILIASLQSAPPKELEEAAFRTAFTAPRVNLTLVPHLEAALDHESPRVLALLLACIGRAVVENPGLVLKNRLKIVTLAKRQDSRVALQAQAILGLAGYMAGAWPGEGHTHPVTAAHAGSPSSFEQKFAALRSAQTARRQDAILLLEEGDSFNGHVRSQPGAAAESTYEHKQELSVWINVTLGELGLSVRCPNTGRSSSLFGQRRGPSDGHGYFAFESIDGHGNRVRETSCKTLPALALVLARKPETRAGRPKLTSTTPK